MCPLHEEDQEKVVAACMHAILGIYCIAAVNTPPYQILPSLPSLPIPPLPPLPSPPTFIAQLTGVEVTELSTNKQLSPSPTPRLFAPMLETFKIDAYVGSSGHGPHEPRVPGLKPSSRTAGPYQSTLHHYVTHFVTDYPL